MRRTRRDVRLLLFSIIALVAGTALVPYLFPPSEALTGASTALGFNNPLAYVCYAVGVAFAGLALARLLPAPTKRDAPDLGSARRVVSWPWLGAIVAGHAFFFAALFEYKGRFVFSEGIYFQALLHRMTQGEIPYVDFSYWYGPAMLYPAHWLGTLVGLEAGYAIWYVITYSVGLTFLFLAMAAFRGPGRGTTALSVLLSIALFNPMTGLNFTLARYLMPTMTFLVADAAMARGGYVRWSLAAALLTVSLLYSFEVAVLGTGSIVLLILVRLLRGQMLRVLERTGRLLGTGGARRSPQADGHEPWRTTARGALLLVVAAVLASAAFFAIDPTLQALAAYPDAARSDLAGAHNSPVYPHLPFITVAAGTIFAVAGVLRLLASAPDACAHLTLGAFLALAVVAQRPSFSVSDPQHYLFFGLATFLLCLHLAMKLPLGGRATTVIVAALVIGLALPQQVYQASQLLPFFRGGQAVGGAGTAAATGVARSAGVEATLTEIARRVGTDRAYLMYGLAYYSMPVHHRLGLRYASYDTDLNSVTTTEVVDRIVEELRQRKGVVVIERSRLDTGVTAFRPDPLGNAIAWLTSAPMPGSDIQAVLFENDALIQAALIDFLRTECRAILELDGYVALEPIEPGALDGTPERQHPRVGSAVRR